MVNTSLSHSISAITQGQILPKIKFLNSQPKNICVFWNVSKRRFFEHPKQMFKLLDKKMLPIYAQHFCLSGPMYNWSDRIFLPF